MQLLPVLDEIFERETDWVRFKFWLVSLVLRGNSNIRFATSFSSYQSTLQITPEFCRALSFDLPRLGFTPKIRWKSTDFR